MAPGLVRRAFLLHVVSSAKVLQSVIFQRPANPSAIVRNGIGQKLTEDKIFEALDSLKDNGVNISNLIIDDNWQSLNHEGGDQFENAMTEFEATKTGFPRGLKATVSDVRKNHPKLKHIAVWHALVSYCDRPTGFWTNII